MKRFLFLLLFAQPVFAATLPHTYVLADRTNGVLLAPTNFLSANNLATNNAPLSAALLTSGTLPDARLSANIPRLDAASNIFVGDLSVLDDVYDATGWNGNSEVPTKNAIRDKIETLSVGGGSIWFDGVQVSNPDVDSTAFGRYVVSGTNITYVPSVHSAASTAAVTPDVSVTDEFVYTMTNNLTLSAFANVSTNHSKFGVQLTFIQGGSGGYQVTYPTNFLFNDRFPGGTIVWTNVGYRAFMHVKPRRDQPAVYDVINFVDGMVP